MILLSLTRLKMVLLLIGIKCKELADFLINFVIFIFIFIIQFIFIFISFQVIVVSAACRSIEVGNSFAANVHCSYFQYISTLDGHCRSGGSKKVGISWPFLVKERSGMRVCIDLVKKCVCFGVLG